MPAYQFTGLTETVYPFDKDAAGVPVGTVQPGDVREFDAAPDWLWTLASEVTALEVSAPAPVPAGDTAQPAPPAVVAPAAVQPFAVTTSQQEG